MERQSSRRRKPMAAKDASSSPAASSSATTSLPKHANNDRKGKKQWSVTVFAVPVAIAILVLFALSYLGNGGFTPAALWLPSFGLREPGSHHAGDLDAGDLLADFALHPEDHIYREPINHYLQWHITAEDRRPDGVKKKVYLINGQFPGPTIEARSGDSLRVTVHNALEEELLSIHWHGLFMRDSNSMDGVIGVTQCGISPGNSSVYGFKIPEEQSGTFWYHAHSAVQRAEGLFGGLIVHKPVERKPVRGLLNRGGEIDSVKYQYERELLFLVGDWYHRSAKDVLAWFMRAGSFGNEPVPDSLLLNGVGRFNCSMAVPARPVDCEGDAHLHPYLVLDPKTTYRIRVVNTGSLAGVTLSFQNAELMVTHLDGGIPTDTNPGDKFQSAGILFPGQRMDLVLRASAIDSDDTSYLAVDLDQGCFKYPNFALTPRHTFPIFKSSSPNHRVADPRNIPQNLQFDGNHTDIENIPSASSVRAELPPKAQQTHIVYTKIEKLAKLHNIPTGFFNRTTWQPQSNPSIPLIHLDREQWDKHQLVLSTGSEPAWIDLVVNNLDEGPHPSHLHGHSFYVLDLYESTFGWGSYNPFTDSLPPSMKSVTARSNLDIDPYDFSSVVLRDTIQIPRRGYAVLRFRADNPGMWFFHCHILWHLAGGMAMTIDVMDHKRVGGNAPVFAQGGIEGMECRME